MLVRCNEEVEIPVGKIKLRGQLVIPSVAEAIIIFSHGSGSSRLSKRNQAVAEYLQQKNFGTLLFDLLTAYEDLHAHYRFNTDLLAERLAGVRVWLEKFPAAVDCRTGYFGASTGAAAALKAAALYGKTAAIVSRGGRPDLADAALHFVKAPTLLIVGSLDKDIMELNTKALEQLSCIKRLAVVNGASHLFEEPGALDEVKELAGAWFERYLYPVVSI